MKLEDEEKSESMIGKNEEEKKKKIRVESSSIREDKGRKGKEGKEKSSRGLGIRVLVPIIFNLMTPSNILLLYLIFFSRLIP